MHRTLRSFLLVALISITTLPTVHGSESGLRFVPAYVPSASVVGQARLRVLFWTVFDATLSAPNGVYQPTQPFALTLSYRRAVDSGKIVQASIDEIVSQGDVDAASLSRWTNELTEIIPDIAAGDQVTGARDAAGETVFYLDETEIGRIADPTFTARFFDIWLGEKSSRPAIREQLVGNLS